MNTPRLPVPPRQSAWSGSKENIDHFGDSGITKLDKHADLKASHGKCVEAIHPAARQLQPAQHYPVPGHLSAHHTTAEPHAEPAPKRSVKPTPKQAAKRTHDVPSQATPPRVDIVSSAQPAQRTKTGFQPNAQYPPSYVGMPANTTGITIGRRGEAK